MKRILADFPQYAHLIGLNTGGRITLNIYPTNEQLLFAHWDDVYFHLLHYGIKSI